MANQTFITNFLLMSFSDVWELQILHAVLFFLIYLAALMGNLLIILVTTMDQHLQTPMYFFLRHLSFIDLCYISVTVPKAILISLTHRNSISFPECVIQIYCIVLFVCAELALLTVMSYDRYAAICHPLHYETLMSRGACVQMAAASWVSGSLSGIMHTASTFSEPFCKGNVLGQFFCEIPHLLKLSCSQPNFTEIGTSVATTILGLGCFSCIVTSYVYIFSTVLKMPSTEGRSKAFFTCLPHLIVTTVFFTTAFVAHVKPTSDTPSVLDLLVSVFYVVVPPTLNPAIYSLRNNDMKVALAKLVRQEFPCFWKAMTNQTFITSFLLMSFSGAADLTCCAFLPDLSGNPDGESIHYSCYSHGPTPSDSHVLLSVAFVFHTSLLHLRYNLLHCFFFICAELALLTVVSYDRYVAVCCPLHYESFMSRGACMQMAVGSWATGNIAGKMHTASTFSEPFCKAFVAHVKPTYDTPSVTDLLVSVFCVVVTPTLNPAIYSLGNKDMKVVMTCETSRLSDGQVPNIPPTEDPPSGYVSI
ncbi:olfactory receptor 14A16-like [Macrotis lagotis]|uniref:olfactory receptor 14A16-like n=1 Tax=Macrotis lagotis TaxID=92651 RepID=UPI003D694E64